MYVFCPTNETNRRWGGRSQWDVKNPAYVNRRVSHARVFSKSVAAQYLTNRTTAPPRKLAPFTAGAVFSPLRKPGTTGTCWRPQQVGVRAPARRQRWCPGQTFCIRHTGIMEEAIRVFDRLPKSPHSSSHVSSQTRTRVNLNRVSFPC